MEILIINNVNYEKLGEHNYRPIFCKAYYDYLDYLNKNYV